MVKVTYNKQQMDHFSKELNNAKARMMAGVKTIIQASILDVMTTAKLPGYVPYKTGNLRRSINQAMQTSETQVIGLVGSNVEYARIQEFGGTAGRNRSTKITGRLYFTRAIKDNAQKIKERFKRLSIINK